MTDYFEIILRLVLAVVAGGLIGLERRVVNKPAGVRTHMLVSLGSALFVLITLETLPSEGGRIIAGIATGIGFLGAGTIFQAKDAVHGLTTAASIWVVAAVGLGIGLGHYLMTITAVVLVLIILQLNNLEHFGKKIVK
ncbi:magnesium transporter MgtC [Candidatus Woesearchaeota archaeon]|jgi:putative Mg2+ transporter-C (MgtC) family protein|nr:magnesium transporter MgtC [Candidatus Woesearchaeota archaeon]MDP6648479.1 MgtC/SapB family protein [Candidatus Woesearchaeota archaeon]|tara:strand:+ start:46502 stop:46915 length:414 start_codon:yes stop_codon:yes gene_type:complete